MRNTGATTTRVATIQLKMEKEKNGNERRMAADDGQTENNHKTPKGGGIACSLVY